MSDDEEMMPPGAVGAGDDRGSRAAAAAAEDVPPTLVVAASRDDDSVESESRASPGRENDDAGVLEGDWDEEEALVASHGDNHGAVAREADDSDDDDEAGDEEEINDMEDDWDDGVDDEEDGPGDRREWDLAGQVGILQAFNEMPAGELRIQKMGVNLGLVPAMVDDPQWQHQYRLEFPGIFQFFVTELGRCQDVLEVELEYANFALEGWDEAPEGHNDGSAERNLEDANKGVDDDDVEEDDEDDGFQVDLALQPDERDLDRLFGTVLSRHVSMTDLSVKHSRLQPRFLNSFAESAAGNPHFSLQSLTIVSTALSAECGTILKNMLQRNVRFHQLSLHRCGLDADGWRLVCEGASANRHLNLLDLKDDVELPTGVVVAALGTESTLAKLHMAPRIWSRPAFTELIHALRVNTELEEIVLSQKGGFSPPQADLVLDLLRTYNFTLLDVQLVPRKDGTRSYEGPIGDLLRRNNGVRRAIEHLESADYRVARRGVWPLALQELYTIPTLMYRFLRRGNVDALAEQVLVGG